MINFKKYLKSFSILQNRQSSVLKLEYVYTDYLYNLPRKFNDFDGKKHLPLIFRWNGPRMYEFIHISSEKPPTPQALEKAIITTITQTRFRDFKLTRGVLEFDFNMLKTAQIEALINVILSNKEKRISYSWLSPLQDLLLDKKQQVRKLQKRKKKFIDDDFEPEHYPHPDPNYIEEGIALPKFKIRSGNGLLEKIEKAEKAVSSRPDPRPVPAQPGVPSSISASDYAQSWDVVEKIKSEKIKESYKWYTAYLDSTGSSAYTGTTIASSSTDGKF